MSERRSNLLPAVLGGVLLVALCSTAAISKEIWSNLRPVQGITPHKQNYLVVDSQIWNHARRDLGDVRLFAGSSEVPYAVEIGQGSRSAQRFEAKLMDMARVDGDAQFIVDTRGAPQCDELDLRLDGVYDFLASGKVQGLNSETQAHGEDLGGSVLFDFTHEGLGSDFTLKFRPSNYKFLRVRLPRVAPEQITRAIAVDTHIDNAVWTLDSEDLKITQEGNRTIVSWPGLSKAPVARIVFEIDPSQENFWRDIQVLKPNGGTITNSSIRRVHIVRDGVVAENESLAVNLPSEEWDAFHLSLANGDDPPLKILSAKAYAFERRIYFDPIGSTVLNLFYGNNYAGAPAYGYAQDFHPDPDAAIATLGPDMQNTENVSGPALYPRPPNEHQ